MIRSLKTFPNALINYNTAFHIHIGCRGFDESYKKYICVHVHAYVKEGSCFCLLYHSHKAIHIMRMKSCTKQQQRITKDPILQLHHGQKRQSYYSEWHVVHMKSMDFRNFGSPLQTTLLLFTMKIAHQHLQLYQTSSSRHHTHLTTFLNFLYFNQTKRD